MMAGKLDHRIRIQRATETQDATTGGVVLTFADWITRWAARREPRGYERQMSSQTVAMSECVYEVRDDSETRTITAAAKYRVIDGSRVYDVTSAEPSVERRSYITLRVAARGEVAA